jgi:hypothetical protein
MLWGIGHWEEDLGTRRIGDKGKDLFQVLTSCPLVLLPPAPYLSIIGGLLYLATRLAKSGKSIGLEI